MTVRNDATRLLLRPADHRHPRAVVARQGQVLLDADLDQESRHLLDRVETGTDDAFGSPLRLVVPAGSTAFAITPSAVPADCGIGPGRGYQRGWLLENVGPCLLATQPHPRTDTTPSAPFLLAVKALVRHVDPVEEPAWADVALGDAQASGRALLDWQVFPFTPNQPWDTAPSCATAITDADWAAMVQPSTGTLAVVPDTAPPATDPCSLAPSGGYSRAENLLYRIEVHGGTPRPGFPTADGPRFDLAGLTIKMSRRNASVLARVTGTAGAEATVTPPALDPLNWFAPGTYAEVVSVHDDVDPRDAAGTQRLFRVARATDTVVTLENAAKPLLTAIAGAPGWFLRLWDAFPDGSGVAMVSTAADPKLSQPIDLGDGLAVRVGAGTDAAGAILRRGDFWTVAARADGTVDWPAGSPHETPHGPETRYAPLAVVSTSAGDPAAEDCRIPLATLTDRVLLYRGGDGQELPAPAGGGFPPLPARLRVAVMRGRTPVTGATVRWSLPGGAGPAVQIEGQTVDAANPLDLPTDDHGLCEVSWAIDAGAPAGSVHQVQAELLSGSGTTEGPAVVFTAGFREPGGVVPPSRTLRLTAIRLLDPAGDPTDLVKEQFILNGLEVPHTAFANAINIGVTGPPIGATPAPFDPIVEVELDLPYPTTDPDRRYWAVASKKNVTGTFGFQRVRLDGDVGVIAQPNGVVTRGLLWKPSAQAVGFLQSLPAHRGGWAVTDPDALAEVGWTGEPQYPRLLCRLRVRSAHVWSVRPDTDERIYLNAEHLGTSDQQTGRELLVEERDPQRAADLDVFFYLTLRD